MGLDTVELVMEVEERFRIKIPDEEASGICTVGEFFACILSKLPKGDPTRCPSAAAFYRLRRALVGVLGVGRHEIGPQTTLSAVLPAGGSRRRKWKELGEFLGLRWDPLTRPRWLTRTILMGMPVALLGPVAVFYKSGPLCMLLGLASLIAYGFLACHLTKPLARALPDGCETVGSAAKTLLARNYGAILGQGLGADWREVWVILRGIISGQLGVKEKDITYDKRFIEDLGCG